MKLGSFLLASVVWACAATAHAVPVVFTTTLSGPAESPPNASPGTGSGTVAFDPTTHSLTVSETFSGLTSPTTASHIHCCTAVPGIGTAGVATMVPTFSGLPLGVTSGSFTQTFDTSLGSTWNPAFITTVGSIAAAESTLLAGMLAGESYLNIHTVVFGSGEIRGFLAPIPEPESYALMMLGLGAIGWVARRRKG